MRLNWLKKGDIMAIKKISAVVAACVAFQVSSTSVAQSGGDPALRFFNDAENFSSKANTGKGGQLEFIYKVNSSYSHYPDVGCHYSVRLADLNKPGVDGMRSISNIFFGKLNESFHVGQYRITTQVVETAMAVSDMQEYATFGQKITPTGFIDLFIYPKWEDWKKNPTAVTSFCKDNRTKIQEIAAGAGINNVYYRETPPEPPPEPKVDCVNTLEFPAHDSHDDGELESDFDTGSARQYNWQERLSNLLGNASVANFKRESRAYDGGTIVYYTVKDCDMADNTDRLARSELIRYLTKIEIKP